MKLKTNQYTKTLNANTENVLLSIIMYREGIYHANFGDRTTADNICSQSSEKPEGYSTYKAFIAYTNDSPLMWLPHDRPIKSKTDNLIANDYNDLFDGTINMTLSNAGIYVSSYFTGMNSDGTSNSNNCNDFSTTNGAISVMIGTGNSTQSDWIEKELNGCGSSMRLTCVAY